MSLSLAIAVNVTADVVVLGFLAWMMSHPRHLAPHGSRHPDVRSPRGQDAEANVAPGLVTLVEPASGYGERGR
jgi:hypothetical protein